MKRFLCVFIVIMIFTSSISFGSSFGSIDYSSRVFQLGIMGQENLNLDRNISRAELATISVRLSGLEYLANRLGGGSAFKDVKGWASPYIHIANSMGYMQGPSKDLFYPKANIQYVELLTVIMRVLEYKDGIDFKNFPDDYYNKAMEIGLANIYIPYDQVMTTDVVASTINRALDLNVKGKDISLYSLQNYYVGKEPDYSLDYSNIYLKDLDFNTTLLGVFSGKLEGINDFSNYKVKLFTQTDELLDTYTLKEGGDFSIDGFPIDVFTKAKRYKYKIFSPKGDLILEDNLN